MERSGGFWGLQRAIIERSALERIGRPLLLWYAFLAIFGVVVVLSWVTALYLRLF